MTRQIAIYDVLTGENVVRDMTPEEEAAYEAELAKDPDPGDHPLSMTDLRLGIIAAGHSIEQIDAAFKIIPDTTTREIVNVWWNTTPVIHWSHPQTQQLLLLAGFSQEQAHAMWVNRIKAMKAGG